MPIKLGQNFLSAKKYLQQIIESADFSLQDEVIEIGAGSGNLTTLIAPKVKKLTAVEIDQGLIPGLRDKLAGNRNTKIINDDIFQFFVKARLPKKYKIVGNIPYYITNKIIRAVLELNPKPESIILLVQKEVGERVIAKDNKHSLLSLSVQVYAKPELLGVVPAGAFTPAPKVDSVILKLVPYKKPKLNQSELETFFKLIKAGFSSKRKTLFNNFKTKLNIKNQALTKISVDNNLNPQIRAEDLSLEDWLKLAVLLR